MTRHSAHAHHHHSSPHGSRGFSATPVHHHHSSYSFGQKIQESGNLNAVVIFPMILLLLVLSPLFYYQYAQNRDLTRSNKFLWTEVKRLRRVNAALMEKSSEKAPLPYTASEIKATEGKPSKTLAPKKPVQARHPSQMHPHFPPAGPIGASPAERTGLSEKDRVALFHEIRLAPDGTVFDVNEAGESVRRTDACAPALETAYYALEQGSYEDAEVTLENLVNSKPFWPYGRFYLAVATNNQKEFLEVQKLLVDARILQAGTTEGDVYLVLASLFLKDTATASETLDRLVSVPRDYGDLPLGPLYVPSDSPASLIKRIKALPGLPALHVAGVPKTAR